MKSQGSFRTLLAFALTSIMTVNPLFIPSAMASQKDDFHEVCDPINNDVTNADGSSNGGDNAKAECAKAEAAMNATKGEKTKTILFDLATATVCAEVAFSFIPYTKAAAEALCNYTSMGASLAGTVFDTTTSSQNSEVVSQFASTSSQVLGAVGTMAPLFMNKIVANASKKAAEEAAKCAVTEEAKQQASKEAAQQASSKLSCIISCAMLGAQAAVSHIAWASSNKAFNTSLNNAKNIKYTANQSTTQMQLSGYNVRPGVPANPTRPTAPKATASEACDDKGGDQYLQCMTNLAPELSAITNNPTLASTMQDALGGKSLGDFAKGFTGETPQGLSNYVGSELGMPSDAAAKLMDAQEKLAKDTGALDKYEPMAYVHSGGGGASSAAAAPDFGSLMSNMLKQLDPNADSKKNEDPSALVFRQLDLLPPEKIVQSKEISLFARIGYRYRKHLDHLEHLNWSIPENQESARK